MSKSCYLPGLLHPDLATILRPLFISLYCIHLSCRAYPREERLPFVSGLRLVRLLCRGAPVKSLRISFHDATQRPGCNRGAATAEVGFGWILLGLIVPHTGGI